VPDARTASPTAAFLEIAPDQPEQLAALLEPGQRFRVGGGRQTLSRARRRSLRRWVQTITALSAEKAESAAVPGACICAAEALACWLAGGKWAPPHVSLRQRLETCLPWSGAGCGRPR